MIEFLQNMSIGQGILCVTITYFIGMLLTMLVIKLIKGRYYSFDTFIGEGILGGFISELLLLSIILW